MFLCASNPVCAISLGARNLELRLANKRATSLPGDGETEYNPCIEECWFKPQLWKNKMVLVPDLYAVVTHLDLCSSDIV